MAISAKGMGEQPLSLRLLLACGAIGPLLFIVVFLIEGGTRPNYSAWHHFVSSLSQGEQGSYLLTRGVRIVALLHCGKTLRVKETTPCFPQSHFLH